MCQDNPKHAIVLQKFYQICESYPEFLKNTYNILIKSKSSRFENHKNF